MDEEVTIIVTGQFRKHALYQTSLLHIQRQQAQVLFLLSQCKMHLRRNSLIITLANYSCDLNIASYDFALAKKLHFCERQST